MFSKSAFRRGTGFRPNIAFAMMFSFFGWNEKAIGQEDAKVGDHPTSQAAPDPAPKNPVSPQTTQRKVKRAARPVYSAEQSGDLFFNDVFAEALLGARPVPTDDSTHTAGLAPDKGQGGMDNNAAGPAASAATWSAFIPASVLEDEIKRQQIRLGGLVTNSGQFQTRNAEIGETFEMLAMAFAIVSQYDQPVRWKDQAPSVTTALIESARQARRTDAAAFENAQRTVQRLGDLVRGGNFGDEVNAIALDDWSIVIERSTLMDRLDRIVSGPLKVAIASKVEFAAETESIVHEVSIIAAIGRVMQMPDMDDAENEDYRAFANEMVAQSRAVANAAIANDFDTAASALNQISQSCVRCHADYR